MIEILDSLSEFTRVSEDNKVLKSRFSTGCVRKVPNLCATASGGILFLTMTAEVRLRKTDFSGRYSQR